MPKALTSTKAYQSLVTDLQGLIQEAQQASFNALNKIRLTTYWKMGQRMARMKQLADPKASGTLISRLAADLNSDPSLLYRIQHFYQTWPRGIPKQMKKGELSWAHVVELLGIKDTKEQDFYFKTALREGWGRDSLRKAIQKDFFSVRSEAKSLKGKKATLKRSKGPLHIYKAVLENVIDGDTLLVRIDLGFQVWVEERIRLRGINTAELLKPAKKDSRAQKAKAFVEKQLKGLDFLVIKTYKTDIYGRYVADIFYHPTIKKKEEVFQKGLFLNQKLLDKGLASPV